MNGIAPDTTVERVATWWEKTIMGADVALGILTILSLTGLVLAARKEKN